MLHSNKLQNKMVPEGATDWLMVFKSSWIFFSSFQLPGLPKFDPNTRRISVGRIMLNLLLVCCSNSCVDNMLVCI
jgi:hypothetical protein